MGPPDDYPGKDREGFRAVLAEILAEALAWRLLEKQYQNPADRELMANMDYQADYGSLMRDFLAVFHKGVAEGTPTIPG